MRVRLCCFTTPSVIYTYRGADLWHPIGNDEQDPIFWYVQIPLYRADDPTIPDDLIVSQNQRFFVEMKSADVVPCTVERRAPSGMKFDSWYDV